MKKQRWYANQELASQLIYQDLPADKFLEKLYPEEDAGKAFTSLNNNKELVEEFKERVNLRGEEWKTVVLEDSNIPFTVSNKGRLITTYRKVDFKQIRVTRDKGILVNELDNRTIPLFDIMDAAGFNYDQEEILKMYWETDYPMFSWPVFAKESIGIDS